MPILPESNERLRSDLPQLSERLLAIAEALPRGGVICDVGSDHGAIPLYLLQMNYASRVIVTDIHEKPLLRARKALEEQGFAKHASFYLTDGIEAVLDRDLFDACVIAGMGGETIVGILSRGAEKLKKGMTFLLQPMTKHSELRRYLYESGFALTWETVVAERDKVFLILCAVYDGISRPQEENVYYFGRYLPAAKTKQVQLYWKNLLSSFETKREGKRRAGLPTEREEEKIHILCRFLEEIGENS